MYKKPTFKMKDGLLGRVNEILNEEYLKACQGKVESGLIFVGPRTGKILDDSVRFTFRCKKVTVPHYKTRKQAKNKINEIVDRVGKHDLAVGFGGVRVIDTGKLVVEEKGIPFYVSIPTVLSNDGWASPVAVPGKGHSLPCIPPNLVLVDTAVAKSAPERYIKSGFVDVLVKYFSTADCRLANIEKGYSFDRGLHDQFYQAAVEVDKSKEKIREMTKKGIKCLAINQFRCGDGYRKDGVNSKLGSGSVHALEHCLHAKATHGEKLAVSSLPVAKKYERLEEESPSLYDKVTEKGRYKIPSSEELARKFDYVGIPYKPEDYGLTREEVRKAEEAARKQLLDRGRYGIINLIR